MNGAPTSSDVRLLGSKRRDLILERVRRNGSVRSKDIAVEFGVSAMTVRRDIDALADAGLVDRVHGGASAASSARSATSSEEPGYAAKSVREAAEKDAIAEAAATVVRAGSSIAITAGTTTAALARRLRAIADLFVVTNSVVVPEIIGAHDNRTVVVTGGSMTRSRALVGPIAELAVADLHVDQVFVGVHGMTSDAGFTTPNMLEAQVVRRLVDAADQVIVVADHTKWGVTGLRTIMPLERADVLVTDTGLGDDALSELRGRIADVRLAAPGSAT